MKDKCTGVNKRAGNVSNGTMNTFTTKNNYNSSLNDAMCTEIDVLLLYMHAYYNIHTYVQHMILSETSIWMDAF